MYSTYIYYNNLREINVDTMVLILIRWDRH